MDAKGTVIFILRREGLKDLVDELVIGGVDRDSVGDMRSAVSRGGWFAESSLEASR